MKFEFKSEFFFIHKNTSEDIICEMAAILFMGRWVDGDSNCGLYSETTWAVGIAQLTHHEVQGGGKNPETGGRGIFAPHREPSGELIAQYRPPMSFCFYPTLYLGNHL